jgi:hypothetical protein
VINATTDFLVVTARSRHDQMHALLEVLAASDLATVLLSRQPRATRNCQSAEEAEQVGGQQAVSRLMLPVDQEPGGLYTISVQECQ